MSFPFHLKHILKHTYRVFGMQCILETNKTVLASNSDWNRTRVTFVFNIFFFVRVHRVSLSLPLFYQWTATITLKQITWLVMLSFYAHHHCVSDACLYSIVKRYISCSQRVQTNKIFMVKNGCSFSYVFLVLHHGTDGGRMYLGIQRKWFQCNLLSKNLKRPFLIKMLFTFIDRIIMHVKVNW